MTDDCVAINDFLNLWLWRMCDRRGERIRERKDKKDK
jgi:hypothetical protein